MVRLEAALVRKGVFFCLIAVFCLGGCGLFPRSKVCFDQDCFSVEVASTPQERSKGLMFRERLGPDRGMLFIFEREARHSFWMKNTKLALDMIWMDGQGRVVFIKKDAQPCFEDACPSIRPDRGAKYVLEVVAGTAERIGLTTFNKATFYLDRSYDLR
jgi:uncharacterized membrane protein (UPF0127 family)